MHASERRLAMRFAALTTSYVGSEVMRFATLTTSYGPRLAFRDSRIH